MSSRRPTILFCLALAALTGCANEPPATTASLASPAAAAGAYQLTSAEIDLNCKDLTGRMQLRILDIRDYEQGRQTSAASRALTSIFGGTQAGSNPSQRYANDRARLEAYNRRLRELSCPSFDLEADLQPKDVKETPLPKIAPP